jgi:hypothetical protein
LVFIGFTDAKNDWIDIVASSDWGVINKSGVQADLKKGGALC